MGIISNNDSGAGTPTITLDPKSCDDLVAAVSNVKEADNGTPALRGEVLFPKADGFEVARTAIWNLDSAGMPLAIVKCANADDVAATIAFARHNSAKICVHTAGAHSNHAVVDDSVVVDLSLLRSVQVDPSTRTAVVAGGAESGSLNATAMTNTAATATWCPTTGSSFTPCCTVKMTFQRP